jgi:hypothetical protein
VSSLDVSARATGKRHPKYTAVGVHPDDAFVGRLIGVASAALLRWHRDHHSDLKRTVAGGELPERRISVSEAAPPQSFAAV